MVNKCRVTGLRTPDYHSCYKVELVVQNPPNTLMCCFAFYCRDGWLVLLAKTQFLPQGRMICSWISSDVGFPYSFQHGDHFKSIMQFGHAWQQFLQQSNTCEKSKSCWKFWRKIHFIRIYGPGSPLSVVFHINKSFSWFDLCVAKLHWRDYGKSCCWIEAEM